MFVRIKSTPYSPRQSVQIVESRRVGQQIKQTILRHVGVADNETELAALKELAGVLAHQMRLQRESANLFLPEQLPPRSAKTRQAAAAPAKEPQTLQVDLLQLREQRRSILGIHDIYGKVYDELGFGRVLGSPSIQIPATRLLRQLVLARLACPLSKRGSVRDLEQRFGIKLSLPAVYRMMDHLEENAVERVKEVAHGAARELFGQKIHLVFYDCTTLYFESFEEDELRSKGFSKENRYNQTQVVLALAVTHAGIPLGYELFPGKMSEGKTFKELLERIQSKWKPSELVVVADSAMLSQENIALLEAQKLSYIVGARLKRLERTLAGKVQDHGAEASVRSIAVDDKSRLVVSFDPKRARKDAHDREKMIQKLTKKLAQSGRAKALMGHQGCRRFLKVEGDCLVGLNEPAVKAAALWDGLHGVRTNLPEMPQEDVLKHYHGLWQVEDCFRVSKHDLRMRPIFHWTASRIQAHVAMCFMALCCVRHLMYRVGLQQGAMSAEAIRRALLSVQASLYEDVSTGKHYELPGCCQAEAQKLYKTMGVKLRATARQVPGGLTEKRGGGL